MTFNEIKCLVVFSFMPSIFLKLDGISRTKVAFKRLSSFVKGSPYSISEANVYCWDLIDMINFKYFTLDHGTEIWRTPCFYVIFTHLNLHKLSLSLIGRYPRHCISSIKSMKSAFCNDNCNLGFHIGFHIGFHEMVFSVFRSWKRKIFTFCNVHFTF